MDELLVTARSSGFLTLQSATKSR